MKTIPEKLPPHCPQSELAALGCAMWDSTLAAELKPEWFFDLRHKAIAETIIGMAMEGTQISVSTVAQKLPGQFAVIIEAQNACHSPANWPYWRDVLNEKVMLRRVINVAHEAIAAATDPDADARSVVDCFERDALAIGDDGSKAESDVVDIKATIHELTHGYERALSGERPGIDTGLSDLDALLGGMKPGQLIILAARPSVGKTAAVCRIIESVALDRHFPVGFFSLEMSAAEIIHRMACSLARVDGSALPMGRATQGDITRLAGANAKLANAPLYLCDRAGLTCAQLLAKGRRMKQRHGIKLLVVDYLQLLLSGEKGRSRYEEVTSVSNALKRIAKELQLPVIALAQLSRANDKEGRPPSLSDLRDSGAIEQDADCVMMLHREQTNGGDAQPITLLVHKNRTGRIGKVRLAFHESFCRFEQATSNS